MAKTKAKVLIVEDNDTMRKLIAADLGQDGRFDVEMATTGAEGLEKAVSTNCDVLILDMLLPDTDGLLFIEDLRFVRPDPPAVIAVTGASATAVPDAVIGAPYRGIVSAVFRKPFELAKLREAVAVHAGV